MTEKEKESLIIKYIMAYNGKDVDGMLNCVDEEVVFRNMAGDVVNMEIYGKNSLEELATQTKDLFSERKQTVNKMTFDEEQVRVDITFNATFAMDLPNGVKAGETMSVDGFSEYKFKDGLISYIADCS